MCFVLRLLSKGSLLLAWILDDYLEPFLLP